MKRELFFWFIAVICILASCSKDEISDQSMVTEKAGHIKGPVTYLTPSGGDDTQAFVDAFAASVPGSVIQLAPGVFHVAYIEVLGFNGCLKGSGRDKTFITPYGLINVGSQADDRNLFPTWWRIIGGDVTLSDFTFRTGDGPLISDVDEWYNKTLACLLMVNNYNADYNPDNHAAMNFNMRNIDFICGYLDPEEAYIGEPYNVLMAFWVGTDVFWPMEDIILTSGSFNVKNCYVDNAFQGFEGFSLGEDAVFTIDGCKTNNCLYGIFNAASYNSRINIINNTLKNTKYYGVWVNDNDFSLLPNVVPFKRCEYVITGNTFYPLPGCISLLMSDELSVVHADKYLPLLVTAKNNLFFLTEGSTGISCLNSIDAVIRNNRFTGTGSTGVYVNGVDVLDPYTGDYLGSGEAKNALILGNNFNGLASSEADIVLGEYSFNCTVVGNGKDDVIDLGTDNKIVGMKKMQGGTHIGPSIRDNFRMMPRMRPAH